MNDYLKLSVVSKIKELERLIDKDDIDLISDLKRKYNELIIDFGDTTTCRLCGIDKHNSEFVFINSKMQDRCIVCHGKQTAAAGLLKSVFNAMDKPIKDRLIRHNQLYKDTCQNCIHENCDNCDRRERHVVIEKLYDKADMEEKELKSFIKEKIIKKEHIEFKRILMTLEKKLLKVKNYDAS